MKEIWW